MTEHAKAGAAAGGAAAHHEEPNYMGVFYALAVLTVAEIGVVFLPVGKFAIGAMLVLLAFAKASLVAAYFMHLKFERRTLAVIAATPILLCVLLMFALLPDNDPGKVTTRPKPAAPAAAPHP
jgi:caa(3)-type oxidase subunit IV